MYANNVVTLLTHLADDEGACVLDPDDEITGAMLVAADGAVIHDRVAEALGISPPARPPQSQQPQSPEPDSPEPDSPEPDNQESESNNPEAQKPETSS